MRALAHTYKHRAREHIRYLLTKSLDLIEETKLHIPSFMINQPRNRL